MGLPSSSEKEETAPSVAFGYLPMLPFPAAAILTWVVNGALVGLVVGAVIIRGGALLCFLAGARVSEIGTVFSGAGGAGLALGRSWRWYSS